MLDPEKIKKAKLQRGVKKVDRLAEKIIFQTKNGEKQLAAKDLEYEKCQLCRYPNPVVYDELIGDKIEREVDETARFAKVTAIEKLPPAERFAFWSEQFSKCIRCYACRNICPACSCEKCVFDNSAAGVAGKAAVDSEDQFFHIIRAYHVAGRCVDCGECSRVCPAGIPLAELNRKIIKDINESYGSYDAGAEAEAADPLSIYQLDDVDPFEGHSKGAKK